MTGRISVQVMEAPDRVAAREKLVTHVVRAHAGSDIARLTLHESEDRPGEFVLIGTASSDAVAAIAPLVQETLRLDLIPLDFGTGPKADLALSPAAGRPMSGRCFIALLPTLPDRHDDAIALLAGEIAATHAEEGANRFIVTETEDRSLIAVIEAWRDTEDWRGHHAHPYCAHVIEALPAMLREEMTVFTLLPVVAGDPVRGLL